MKKVLLVAVAGLFVLASCKKDRDCECVVTFMGETVTSTTTLAKTSKSDAETACNAGDISGMSECEIK